MPPELNHLQERLLQAGIKPGLAARYVAELCDHFADLLETETAEQAWRRLGSPDSLAAAMLTQPGVRSWTARAPWAILALGPLSVLLLGYVIPALILLAGVRAFASDLDYGRAAVPGTWPYSLLHVLTMFNEHILPVLAGWGAVLVAVRQRAELRWLVLGVVLTAILGGGLFTMVDLQAGHPAHLSFLIGLKFEPLFSTILGRSLESVVVNLAAIIGLYAVLRLRVERRL